MYEENLIHKTSKGEKVRSKSEVIIANLLYAHGIEYEYEKPLVGKGSVVIHPDFTLWDQSKTRHIFIEHLGMANDKRYMARWQIKEAWYRENGIQRITWLEVDKTTANILLVTSEEKGIDARLIEYALSKLRMDAKNSFTEPNIIKRECQQQSNSLKMRNMS